MSGQPQPAVDLLFAEKQTDEGGYLSWDAENWTSVERHFIYSNTSFPWPSEMRCFPVFSLPLGRFTTYPCDFTPFSRLPFFSLKSYNFKENTGAQGGS